ncbi:MAG: integration host factor subunit alpha [Gammaproteobacteria bacterium]|nr:integration host factor subunit alpha [Gammaproteobacteria bacterium]
MSLTKADIALNLSKLTDVPQQKAREWVDAFFEELRGCLEEGTPLKFSSFGNFDLKDKTARPGRNPKTGIEVQIEPRRVVTFKAGQKLRQVVAEGK